MKLTHVRLLVKDVQNCYNFYKDVLELEEHLSAEDLVYVEFKAGDIFLALYQKDLMTEVLGAGKQTATETYVDTAVLTIAVPDVDALYKELSAKGVQFVKAPQDQTMWFLRVAHLRDPEGNLIELNAPIQDAPAA